MSHYTCLEENYGGTHYCPWGNRTASGTIVEPSVAACSPDLLGKTVQVGGWGFRCDDTGSLVRDRTLDIHCYSFQSWGPTDPYFIVSESPVQYAKDQWWWGLSCPAPCEQEIDGRCYAKVRVME
jgi:hypothetical protein